MNFQAPSGVYIAIWCYKYDSEQKRLHNNYNEANTEFLILLYFQFIFFIKLNDQCLTNKLEPYGRQPFFLQFVRRIELSIILSLDNFQKSIMFKSLRLALLALHQNGVNFAITDHQLEAQKFGLYTPSTYKIDFFVRWLLQRIKIYLLYVCVC